jgi:putative glycosyltransferase (TIGR04348 family)
LATVRIVSPALADANNGNWQTAARWQRFLAPVCHVSIAPAWDGAPLDALIALHARRSAASIAGFRAARADAPIALVLTGTDLYRDLVFDSAAQHALECASHVVVLQDEALQLLAPSMSVKARCIVQSAARMRRRDAVRRGVTFVAVGHLRDEKDPATLLRAVHLLPAAPASPASPATPASPALRVVHIGRPLDPALGEQALQTMQACARYRWLGDQPHPAARRWIARAQALVHMSRMEGGANVVIEALRSGVPVLASRIDGNVGLLGRDYAGYFDVGDAAALAALMQRFATDTVFAAHLRTQCARREARFAPAVERAAVRALLADMLGARRPAGAPTIMPTSMSASTPSPTEPAP